MSIYYYILIIAFCQQASAEKDLKVPDPHREAAIAQLRAKMEEMENPPTKLMGGMGGTPLEGNIL